MGKGQIMNDFSYTHIDRLNICPSYENGTKIIYPKRFCLEEVDQGR